MTFGSDFNHLAEDANPFYKAWNDVQNIELDVAHEINEVLGINRSQHGSVLQQKRRFIPDSDENTPLPKKQATTHRSINTGPHTMGNDGNEVEVVPPPKKIAKTIPDYSTIKLAYYDRVSTGAIIAPALSTYIFRLNSVFDPDVTGVGHQPLGRDHWAQTYKYYRVLSCEVTLKWYNATDVTGAIRTIPELVGYELTDDVADIYSDWQAWVEGKHSKVDLLLNTSTEFAGSGGHTTTQTFHYSPSQWDIHVHESGISERWTPVGENPATQHFMALHQTPAAGSGATYEAVCMVYLSYTVQFRELQASKKKTKDS